MRKAVQQMMLGSVLKNEAGALEILKKIRSFGYDAIELNRYMIHPTPLAVRILTKAAGMPSGNGGRFNWPELVKQSGLEVLSLHTDLGSLEKDFEGVVKDAKDLCAKYVVITGMYRFNYQKEEEVRKLAERLNIAGKKLKQEGFPLLYHNHNVELVRVNEQDTAYGLLVRSTDPEYVNFELDTYWMTEGGADAKQIMEKLGSRMKLWHMTDRGFRIDKTPGTPIVKTDSVELGTGNMDLDGLVKIAERIGTEGAVVETHRNWIHNDPIESIEVSSRYLNRVWE